MCIDSVRRDLKGICVDVMMWELDSHSSKQNYMVMTLAHVNLSLRRGLGVCFWSSA